MPLSPPIKSLRSRKFEWSSAARSRRGFLAAVLAAGLCVAPAAGQDSFDGVRRIVAVGDIHGDFDNFAAVLRSAGLIDEKNKWTGGDAHLVQTGDVPDRGPDTRKILDLLMDLEKQARRSKGRVHALLGNHETMNIYGDLRYVSPGEYESFRSRDSAELQKRAFESFVPDAERAAPGAWEKFQKEHPLGWVEHRQAFADSGKYGRWLRDNYAVLRVNDALFLHGGISPKVANMPIRDINKQIRDELRDFTKIESGLTRDPEGPLWYRGLAQGPEAELAGHVDAVLKSYGVRHIVLGHTPTPGAVMPRFGGKVLLNDVGLSKAYNGAPVCLIIEGGKFFAMHRGTRIEIPVNGGDIGAYLKAAAAADPPGSRLRKVVESGTFAAGDDEK
jgi:hypothetical protein